MVGTFERVHVLYLVAGDEEADGAELLMADGDSALGSGMWAVPKRVGYEDLLRIILGFQGCYILFMLYSSLAL